MDQISASPQRREQPQAGQLSMLACGIALLAAVIWVYLPTLIQLSELWAHDPKYSHGYLVPLFSLAFVWLKVRGSGTQLQPSWLGVVVVFAGLMLRGLATYSFYPGLAAYSLLLVVGGCVLCLGGVPLIRQAWPAVGFLVLMMPLPYRLESALAGPLQQWATSISVYLLQTLGYPAYADGNIICLHQGRVNVAEACNGLSMIMMFVALAAAVVLLSHRPLLDKVIILVSAVPIAIFCNVVRIAASAILYVSVGTTLGDLIPATKSIALGATDLHDITGYLMMPVALVFLWGELRLLDWVFPESPRGAIRPNVERFSGASLANTVGGVASTDKVGAIAVEPRHS